MCMTKWQVITVAAGYGLKEKITTWRSVLISTLIKSKANTHFQLALNAVWKDDFLTDEPFPPTDFHWFRMHDGKSWLIFYHAQTLVEHPFHIPRGETSIWLFSWRCRYMINLSSHLSLYKITPCRFSKDVFGIVGFVRQAASIPFWFTLLHTSLTWFDCPSTWSRYGLSCRFVLSVFYAFLRVCCASEMRLQNSFPAAFVQTSGNCLAMVCSSNFCR